MPSPGDGVFAVIDLRGIRTARIAVERLKCTISFRSGDNLLPDEFVLGADVVAGCDRSYASGLPYVLGDLLKARARK